MEDRASFGGDSIILMISNSALDFYNGNARLVCYDEAINPTFLNKIGMLSLTTLYALKTCPFIFRNSALTTLQVNSLCEHFLKQNMLEFQPINSTRKLNSTVSGFTMDGYVYNLKRSTLNEQVFEQLVTFSIS
jgi:hypothetical protein